MAYVQGPLHSDKARGQFAKSSIFQTYRNRTYVKKYAVPGNTPGHDKMNQSPAQLAHQSQFAAIAAAWSAASASDKASWDVLAEPDHITNYAAYTRENWERVLSGREISTVWPAVEGPKIAGTVTNCGEAPWNPDISGDWVQIEDINGLPAFKHVSLNFWIFYVDGDIGYIAADDKEATVSTQNWIHWISQPEGEYQSATDTVGWFQFTLI